MILHSQCLVVLCKQTLLTTNVKKINLDYVNKNTAKPGYIHCNKEILVMYLTLNLATDIKMVVNYWSILVKHLSIQHGNINCFGFWLWPCKKCYIEKKTYCKWQTRHGDIFKVWSQDQIGHLYSKFRFIIMVIHVITWSYIHLDRLYCKLIGVSLSSNYFNIL